MYLQKFPLRLFLSLTNSLGLYYLISKCLEIYLLFSVIGFQFYSIVVWKHTLYNFNSFKFGKVYFMTHNIVFFVSECSMGAWKECVFCHCWVNCHKYQLDPIVWWFSQAIYPLSTSSINCCKGVEVPNYWTFLSSTNHAIPTFTKESNIFLSGTWSHRVQDTEAIPLRIIGILNQDPEHWWNVIKPNPGTC